MIRYFSLFIVFLVSLNCCAKIVQGKIIDSNDGESISFATIAINDSLTPKKLIVADKDGVFKVEMPDTMNSVTIQISSIGYETLTYVLSEKNALIKMSPKVNTLAGVTISKQRNTIKLIDSGIEVKIKDSPLSEMSISTEMIRQLPFVDAVSEGLNILGKRNTAIYINSHRIEDLNEIKELTPKQIDNVKILTSPSLKYGRDVDAVIIIKTIRNNIGIAGFSSGSFGLQKGRISYGDDTQLTWTNKQGFSLLGGVSYSYDSAKGDLFTTEVVPNTYTTETEGIQKSKKKLLSMTVASFFEKEKTNYGVKYRFTRTPSNVINKNYEYSTKFSSEDIYNGKSNSFNKSDDYRHWMNIYYNHNISSAMTFSSDINGYIGEKHSFYNDFIATDLQKYNEEQMADYKMEYKLLDCRADVDYTHGKLNFNAGVQYTFTSTMQTFDGRSSILGEQTTNRQEQNLLAIYSILKLKLNSTLNIRLGIRDEIEILNYKQNEIKIENSSGTHNYITPSMDIIYHHGDLKAILSYNYNLYRPAYSFLSENVTFITPTLYARGNPFLQNDKEHQFDLSLFWKKSYIDFRYGISLDRVDNAVVYDEEQTLSFMTPSLIGRMGNFAFVAQQRLDIGFWHPTITAILLLQNAKYGTPQRTYNKPYFRLQWKNLFNLPYKIRLYPTFYYESSGNTNLYSIHDRFITSVSINRSFGNWSFVLSAKDIFNSWKNEYEINTNNMNYRVYQKYGTTISVDITYNFNTVKKKYKGKSNASELNRL